MTILIGLAGRARSGKDSIGQMLIEGYGVKTIAFAEPIKAMLRAMFEDDIDLEGPGKEEIIPWLGKSPRYLMQTLGTEWGRDMIDPNLWVKIASMKYHKRVAAGAEAVVVTDVRFESERAWIDSEGGIIWHIHRPLVESVEKHSSEGGIDQKSEDLHVFNTSTLEALREDVLESFGRTCRLAQAV